MSYKSIRVREFGDSSVLHLEELPDPNPSEHEVVIRIHAAGVNPVDTYIRSGLRGQITLPYTPGSDVAGEVIAVGSKVQRWKVGDRVYKSGLENGAYAQKGVWHENSLQSLPPAVSYHQGAAVHVPYGTAYYALFQRAGAKPGETVLIHGGSGGVGIASIQFAKSRGLTVFATAGTADGLELCSAQGADRVFNHRTPGYMDDILKATNGKGVDVVLEMLANVNLNADLGIMALRGRVIVVGSRGTIEFDPRRTMVNDVTITGIILGNATDAEMSEIAAAIGSGLAIGFLRPIVGPVFRLSEASVAHDYIINPPTGASGKVIIDPLQE